MKAHRPLAALLIAALLLPASVPAEVALNTETRVHVSVPQICFEASAVVE
ncbi:hypothetical protein [Sorangium sp. So ce426]